MKFLIAFGFLAVAAAQFPSNEYLPPLQGNSIQPSNEYLPPFQGGGGGGGVQHGGGGGGFQYGGQGQFGGGGQYGGGQIVAQPAPQYSQPQYYQGEAQPAHSLGSNGYNYQVPDRRRRRYRRYRF